MPDSVVLAVKDPKQAVIELSDLHKEFVALSIGVVTNRRRLKVSATHQ